MKTIDTVLFTVHAYVLSALVNDDYTAFDDDEAREIASVLDYLYSYVNAHYPEAAINIGDISAPYFGHPTPVALPNTEWNLPGNVVDVELTLLQ